MVSLDRTQAVIFLLRAAFLRLPRDQDPGTNATLASTQAPISAALAPCPFSAFPASLAHLPLYFLEIVTPLSFDFFFPSPAPVRAVSVKVAELH